MRNFQLTIVDLDGERQSYRVLAKDPHVVARRAGFLAEMYGHDRRQASEVIVEELVATADMTNAVELYPNGAPKRRGDQ